MPVKSPAQFRLMQMAKNNPDKMKSGGPSPKVAAEFLSKTPEKKKKQFAKAPR